MVYKQKAILRHAGPNATSWVSKTGKIIFENPVTGRQVVIDASGYFRIFQPKTFGSIQGEYLILMGTTPMKAVMTKGGIKLIPMTGSEVKQATLVDYQTDPDFSLGILVRRGGEITTPILHED